MPSPPRRLPPPRKETRTSLPPPPTRVALAMSDRSRPAPPPRRDAMTREYGRVGGWAFTYMLDPTSWLAQREKKPVKLNYDDLEEMTSDPQVASSLAVVKLPIIATNFRIKSESDEISKETYENLSDIWYPLITNLLTSLDYGFSAQEKTWWSDSDGRWRWGEFLPILPKQCWLKRHKNSFNGFAQGRSDTTSNPWVPAEKAFVFSNDRAEVFGNYYGRPRTWGAYLPWWLKKHVLRWTGLYYEQSAQPMKEGRAPTRAMALKEDGSGMKTIDGQKWLYDEVIAKIAAGQTGYTLPSDRDEKGNFIWDIIQKELDKRGVDYIDFLEYLDIMIGRGTLIPDLTVFQNRSDEGSRSMSQQHGQMFWSMQAGLLEAVRYHLNQYMIKQYVAYNWGPKAPRTTWEYEPLSPQKVEWLKNLVDRMVQRGSAQPNLDELQDRLGIGIEKLELPPTTPFGDTGGKTPRDGSRDNRPKLEELERAYLGRFPKGQMFLAGV